MMKLMVVMVVLGLLSGCASKERKEARAGCSVEAMQQFPPQIERQTVNRVRAVSVADGTMSCTTIGTSQFATTNCTAGTKLDLVPYTSVENVDLNKSSRDQAENSCTDRTCYQRYGNTKCKTDK
jgi:hypothetical protein